MDHEEDVMQAVRREVAREGDRRDRRQGDKFFETWIKPILPYVLGGVIGSAVWLWVEVKLLDNEVARIKTEQVMQNNDIRMTLENRDFAKNLQVVMDLNINRINDRFVEMDKRMQMQGEGLVAGNRSIHEILEKFITLSSDISTSLRRIEILEGEFSRLKADEDKVHGRK